MKRNYTVKARTHHGSKSLDLTIPVDVVKTLNINVGDIFRLQIIQEEDNIILQYDRVYENQMEE